MIPFTHLHVHSQYSILDGAASVSGLVTKAKNDGMTALALTDHGNMFGIKEFHDVCKKNGIKPILGVETYVASRGIHFKDKNEKEDRSGDHLILLARNRAGYKNLLKLVTVANTEGMYYKPRIDKQLLQQHSEGLIVSTACLGGEIPQLIMKNDMQGVDEAITWYKSIFGEDFYLELQRHPAADPEQRQEVYDRQVEVNKVMLQLAEKHNIKLIATNDVHFVNREDADAHDLLICLNTGKDLDDATRMRYTKEEWMKSTEEMNGLFGDLPHVLENTQEIVDKVEFFELNASPIMPEFPIPDSFGTEAIYRERFSEEQLMEEFGKSYTDMGGYEKTIRVKFESDYLGELVRKGAVIRYGDELTPEVQERIDFELQVIKTMGFPGYFLIVQDFINAARQMGVIVGPGRGSAAGSVVAYTTGITNVDPLKYDLLFERFLNPDRISMPDIDIDFDDDGRQLVLNLVKEKYGRDRVAHICTFGTMAAKMAIRDVGRVLRVPLPVTDRIAKLVPDTPKITLKEAYAQNPLLERERNSTEENVVKMLKFAGTLEGCVRQFGVHACGVIIGRDPLEMHIPLMPTKDEDLLTTQYDGHFVESIGLMKMDFLGLKTLSIIKECLENIKLSRKINLNIDQIPMDDAKTFELFSAAETTAIFQFESAGMKKWLKQLQSNCFEDLVAMNALYRPGPMDYIPSYISRKHKREEVTYDHPMMEPYLKDTYGITVYQEQVMLQARALANFTRGQSDSLRKAMGKKDRKMMDELKVKFKEGCKKNEAFTEGCKQMGKAPDTLTEKIWKDWESFASYAFNKSHSVCYAFIAYQTGYLKAHYLPEFMAAVLSCNLSNSDKISLFMDECKHMGLNVLGPDINESRASFFVNKSAALRFGLTAIKGVGAGAVADILKERDLNGEFKSVYDLVERVNLQSANKKNLEALAIAGTFDSYKTISRAQFFADMGDGTTFIESLIRYGNKIQGEKSGSMANLFGDVQPISIKQPSPPQVPEWPNIVALEKEKNVIGIYLSAHPLDEYRLEIESYCTKGVTINDINDDISAYKNRDITIAGIVTDAQEAISKNGKNFASMTLTDYNGSLKMMFFGNDYVAMSKYCKKGLFLLVKGKVMERWSGGSELEFKASKIELLEELASNAANLTIELPVDELMYESLNDLEKLMVAHPGKTTLKFNFVDPESDLQVPMFSRNRSITLSAELKSYLQNQSHIKFSIN